MSTKKHLGVPNKEWPVSSRADESIHVAADLSRSIGNYLA